jgi:hypothetical protein
MKNEPPGNPGAHFVFAPRDIRALGGNDAADNCCFATAARISETNVAFFVFDGERIPLINPQRGIFKPQQMRLLLSIKTVFPKPGGKVWYDDQREVHRQIFEDDETIDYAFMGQDPDVCNIVADEMRKWNSAAPTRPSRLLEIRPYPSCLIS